MVGYAFVDICDYSPATMSEESKETFGVTTPIGRAGQPVEIATCFVFLASADSSYMRYDCWLSLKSLLLTDSS